MSYWKRDLNKEQVRQEVHKKKNHIYVGERNESKQLFCKYPELGKGNEGFGFWFESKAIALLDQEIDNGATIDRYAGSQSQQFYIRRQL